MAEEKKKSGAGKFFLGALLGGALGAVAGKFIKVNIKNEDECDCDEDCECDGECECDKKEATEKEAPKKKTVVKKAPAKKTSEKK